MPALITNTSCEKFINALLLSRVSTPQLPAVITVAIFISLFGFVQSGLCQYSRDSVRLVFDESFYDSSRVELAIRIANEYADLDIDSSFYFAAEGLKIAEANGDKKGCYKSSIRTGLTYYAMGDHKKGIKHFLGLLEKFREEKEVELFKVYNNLGIGYRKLGEYDQALKFYLQAIELLQDEKDKKNLANICINLSSFFLHQDDLERSKNYLSKAISILDKEPSSASLGVAYMGRGNIFFEEDSLSNALFDYQEAEKIFEGQHKISYQLRVMNNIAITYELLGEYEKEEAILKECIRLELASASNPASMLSYTNNLGTHYLDRGKPKAALPYLQQALGYAFQIQEPVKTSPVLENLALIYEDLHQLDSALAYRKRYEEIQDTLYNRDRAELITEMQEKYEAEKKDQTIQMQAVEMKAAQQRLYLSWSIFAGIVLVALLLIYAWSQRQKAVRLAAERETEAERQRVLDLMRGQEISLLNAMMDGQEQERKRVAQELHDRVGSMLSTVKLQLSQLESEGAALSGTNELVDQTCEEVRRISHDMEAGVLAEHGLQTALEDLCDSLQQHSEFALHVDLFGLEASLPRKVERHLFAIIQEGLNNVVKYARATEVYLSLTRHETGLTLMLEDNGKGFDPEAAIAKGGMGLRNLQHRTDQIEASLTLDAALGRGSSLILEVPIEA